MRRALVAIGLIAGCSTDQGVAVFVHPSSGDVAYVRLYLGEGGSTTANLTSASGVTADRANYWQRVAHNDLDVLPVTGDVVKFGFITDHSIPVAIAVGYDQNKQPIEVGYLTDISRKPADDVSAYELDLQPAARFGDNTNQVQLSVWSPYGQTPASPIDEVCAGVIDPSADHPVFVVYDTHDQDCDGNLDGTTGECTPDEYLGSAPPDSDRATCLSATAAPPSCRFGGQYCTDTNATSAGSQACNPSNVCMPSLMCSTCAGDSDPVACAKNLPEAHPSITSIAHYECDVPTGPDGKTCEASLRLPLPPTGGYDCSTVRIGDATRIGDELPLGSEKVTLQSNACDAKLEVPAQVAVTASTSGYIQWDLDNGGSIAMPIDLAPVMTSGCSSTVAVQCTRQQELGDVDTQRCVSAWTPQQTGVVPATAGVQQQPTLSHDLTEIVYRGDTGLMYGKRSNPSNPFSTVAAITSLPGDMFSQPEFNKDSSKVLLVGTGGVYVSTHDASNGSFGTPMLYVANSTGQAITSATWEPDGSLVVAIEPVPNPGTTSSLAHITISNTTIATIDPIDVGRSDVGEPHESLDGLHLYFTAVEAGGTTQTIYVMSRATPSDTTWSPPIALTELMALKVASPWVSPDAKTLVYVVADKLVQATRADL